VRLHVAGEKSQRGAVASREMEILCNDQIYQEAVAMATGMIHRLL
jgi:hypothetical protein